MRVLIVHPGANHSVSDVFNGYAEALERAGHVVFSYPINAHLEIAARYLVQQQKFLSKTRPDLMEPITDETILVKASEGILLAALRARVDLVLIISALYVHPQALLMLRAARIPAGVIFTESPYMDEDQSVYPGLVSACWTNERTSVPVLQPYNTRTYYLPAAYRAGFHVPGEAAPGTHAHDVLFVGTLFEERAELLAAVDWTGIDLGIYGNLPPKRSRLYRRLKPHIRGGVMANADALNLYRAARILVSPVRTSVFQDSGEHVQGESTNPRTYELAAGGLFQLAGERAEVREIFQGSVPIYRDAADLGEMIRHYLAHPEERTALAEQARAQTVGHSFDDRAEQLVRQVTGVLLHNPFFSPTTFSGRVAAD